MGELKDLSGEGLERLVALIETSVAEDPRYKLERRKRLRDRITGRLREFDVLITWTDHHHRLVTAIECRDRNRPVGVPDVDTFHAKIQRTDVDRGLIVSSSGFQDSARELADTLGIGCLEMEVAEAFDWCAAPGIVSTSRQVKHIHVTTILEDTAEEELARASKPLTLYSPDGIELTAPILANNVASNLAWDTFPTNEELSVRIVIAAPGVVARSKVRDFKVRTLILDSKVSVIEELQPFLFHSYKSGDHVYAAASGSIEVADKTVTMALVQDPTDGLIRVVVSMD